MKHSILVCLLALLPLFCVAQKVTIKGVVLLTRAEKIVFERLKKPSSWKIFKGSNYESKLDSGGNFNLSFPIADSGLWKITVGDRRLKIHVNTNQNLYLELDSNLAIRKIIRQDLIDSPIGSWF
jgi:hypothetical protein